MSENAHRAVFGKLKPAGFDRIDYALLAVSDGVPRAYATAKETDFETVHWEFGGAFAGTIGTTASYRAFKGFIAAEQEAKRKRIRFYVENTNEPMLKLAMKTGFRIQGLRNYGGTVLLEHVLEF